MKTEDERKVEFLIGLTRLTRETGIAVTGCGCCGSPDLMVLQPAELDERAGYGYGYTQQVAWISPSGAYDWNTYAHTIVRPAANNDLRRGPPSPRKDGSA